jgi:ribosomal protein S18 acetylase RimI-like enzyme
VGTDARLLEAIERYCDGVPRSSADAVGLGPFTIFLSRIPWRYYARPRLGLDLAVTAEDVAAARERQRAEGVPERFEWIAEITPSLAGAATDSGLTVTRVPLMALEAASWRPAPPPEGVTVRVLDADDTQVATANAAVELAFIEPHGTRRARMSGAAERDALAERSGGLDFLRDRLARRVTVMAAAEDGDGPLASGSAQPLDDVVEITGVGTLPGARRRGLAAAVTSRLVEDAREHGAQVVFLSAADATVAALYGRLGFREIGTACFGRLPGDGP